MLRLLYGRNTMHVKLPSILSLSLKEAIHPFYLFQVASITLWILEDYIIYAGIILGAATLSAVSTVYQIRGNAAQLRDLAKMEGRVKVIREIRRGGEGKKGSGEEEIEREREEESEIEERVEEEENLEMMEYVEVVEDGEEGKGEREKQENGMRGAKSKFFVRSIYIDELVPGDVVLLEDQMVSLSFSHIILCE